jgi:DNA-binding phage protein
MTNRQSSIVDKAMKLVDGGQKIALVAKKLGIARSTIYRAIKRKAEKA